MKKLAIFASGTGSNAKNIIDKFKFHPSLSVTLVVCNKPGAGVISIAEKAGVPVLLIDKERFMNGDAYISELKKNEVDVIILAGFLWKIPIKLIEAYQNLILNIHPSLLPAHGGKGMYGMNVHKSVIAAGDTKSGITIHIVDELFDNGEHIFQTEIPILKSETPESLASRIHDLEHKYFPDVIENFCT